MATCDNSFRTYLLTCALLFSDILLSAKVMFSTVDSRVKSSCWEPMCPCFTLLRDASMVIASCWSFKSSAFLFAFKSYKKSMSRTQGTLSRGNNQIVREYLTSPARANSKGCFSWSSLFLLLSKTVLYLRIAVNNLCWPSVEYKPIVSGWLQVIGTLHHKFMVIHWPNLPGLTRGEGVPSPLKKCWAWALNLLSVCVAFSNCKAASV